MTNINLLFMKILSDNICSKNFEEIINFVELWVISYLKWSNLKTQVKG